MPDIDLALVGSRPSRSHDSGHEHRDQGNRRFPQVETTGAVDSDGF